MIAVKARTHTCNLRNSRILGPATISASSLTTPTEPTGTPPPKAHAFGQIPNTNIQLRKLGNLNHIEVPKQYKHEEGKGNNFKTHPNDKSDKNLVAIYSSERGGGRLSSENWEVSTNRRHLGIGLTEPVVDL
jgi:hypothetical protein